MAKLKMPLRKSSDGLVRSISSGSNWSGGWGGELNCNSGRESQRSNVLEARLLARLKQEIQCTEQSEGERGVGACHATTAAQLGDGDTEAHAHTCTQNAAAALENTLSLVDAWARVSAHEEMRHDCDPEMGQGMEDEVQRTGHAIRQHSPRSVSHSRECPEPRVWAIAGVSERETVGRGKRVGGRGAGVARNGDGGGFSEQVAAIVAGLHDVVSHVRSSHEAVCVRVCVCVCVCAIIVVSRPRPIT